jgi:DtxR family Mn-dependent transcriptional regulator
MLRRHRLIEVFLVETLGLDWAEVHDEAERLEHAMSGEGDRPARRVPGTPSIDPHGDPIPDAQGQTGRADRFHGALADGGGRPRDESHGSATRTPRSSSSRARHGLKPGTRVKVVEVVPEAESISVRAGRDASR